MRLDAKTLKKPYAELTPEERRLLAGDMLIGFSADRSFWWPRIQLGHTCWDLVIGKFFTADELAEFVAQNKIPVQIPELVPKLQALLGLQIMSRRNPVLAGQRVDDAVSAEDLNIVIESIEGETGLDAEETEAYKNAVVTSYPSFIWFEKPVDYTRERTVEICHEAWDAVYPDPGYRRKDLRDLQRLRRIRQMSREEILDRYGRGDRRPEIEAALSDAPPTEGDEGWSAEERSALLRAFAEGTESARHNRHFIVETLWFQREKVVLFASPKTDQMERLPEDWDPARIAQWQKQNPDYRRIEVPDFKRLWVTTITGSGTLLAHDPHWYQEEDFPCEGFVADQFNNQAIGLVEFHKDNLRLGAHMETEQLHSVRGLTDGVVALLEGAIANLEDVQDELAKPHGRVIVKKGNSIDEAIKPLQNRRENTAWREMKLQTLDTLDRLSFDRNFEGGTQSSQESGRVVGIRLKQSQGKLLPVMTNFNSLVHRVRRKLLRMLPYLITGEQTFRRVKGGKASSVTVNEPELDWATGEIARISNRLDQAKFDFVVDEADNSLTGLENELERFLEIMSQAMPNIPSEMWPAILGRIPNRICQEIAQGLAEMQAQQGGPETVAKLNFNIEGKDLPYNPLAQQMAQKAGVLDAPPAPAPTPAPVAPQPEGPLP